MDRGRGEAVPRPRARGARCGRSPDGVSAGTGEAPPRPYIAGGCIRLPGPKYAGSCIYVSKFYSLGLVCYFNTQFKPLIPLQ